MSRHHIPLFLTPGCSGIYLQPIRGREELNIEQTDTATAIDLLQAMLVDKDNGAIKASSIVTADRDRILAALYDQLYGSRIESTVLCSHCREKFDIDFSLTSLLEQVQPEKKLISNNGIYQTAEGIAFRLPTGDDELRAMAAVGMDPVQTLLNQCLVGGALIDEPAIVEEQMAALAPVLNLEMQAHCPECRQEQRVRFDMQSFLLMRLKREKPRLLYEVHRIAAAYHWSMNDILQLPRLLRKQYVGLIEAG